MTASDFERWYAAMLDRTTDELRCAGYRVEPCACGRAGCDGWRMLVPERERRQAAR